MTDQEVAVEAARGSIEEFEADALVVNLFCGVTEPGGATGAVDRALGGRLTRVISHGDFGGRLGETLVLDSPEGVAARRVVLVGLGSAGEFGLEEARRAAASAVGAARRRGARHVATIAHGAGIGGLDPGAAAQATIEGTLLGAYEFRHYKSSDRDETKAPLERVTVVEASEERLPSITAGAEVGRSVAAGVKLARDLGNHPANVATPRYLVDRAGEIAQRHGMNLEVWDRARFVEEGMGALASVAAGTSEPPFFFSLEHCPSGASGNPPYVLAGKAITFDSGGISLKPGLRMGRMKYDMCGGAAVLGTLEAVGRLALPLRVVGLVAATENLPSGTATKPGDIVRALNGVSIEVLNTDAEGRMVLADALSYAQRLNPRAVVDLATLTGAVVTALGRQAAGLFANDDSLAMALESASTRSGERIWRMPLWDEYDRMIESDVADIKNTSDTRPAPAGAIFGAKFLQRFVDYPWAHLDIAGMAWGAKGVEHTPKGATGFGVRLLADWLRSAADEPGADAVGSGSDG